MPPNTRASRTSSTALVAGRDEERGPRWVTGGTRISVKVREWDCGDRTPERVSIFRLPAAENRVGLSQVHEREQMRFLQQREVKAFRHLQRRAIPEPGGTAIPKDRKQSLVGRARRLGVEKPGVKRTGRAEPANTP